MARPLKSGLDYFSHDTSALDDRRIQRLITEYGLTGYGFYFALLEAIYADMPKPYRWDRDGNSAIFARRCRISSAKAQRMLNFCLEIQLFDQEIFDQDSTLISSSIRERAEAILKAREAKRKWRETIGQFTGQTDGQTAGQTGESKLKEQHNNKSTAVVAAATTASETELLEVIKTLPGWQYDEGNDLIWLRNFLHDFPDTTVFNIKHCCDYYSDKQPCSKGYLKNLVRKWMRREERFEQERRSGKGEKIPPRALPQKYTDPDEL